ncbi:MAG: hypothetical protein ABSC49_00135 [Candidatus Microgenomates bacterium]|jgi:hypothetical protein
MDPTNTQDPMNPVAPVADPNAGMQTPPPEPMMPTPPPATPAEPVAPIAPPEQTPPTTEPVAMPEPPVQEPTQGIGDAGAGMPPTTPPAAI